MLFVYRYLDVWTIALKDAILLRLNLDILGEWTYTDHARHYYTLILDRCTVALKDPVLHCVNLYFDILLSLIHI